MSGIGLLLAGRGAGSGGGGGGSVALTDQSLSRATFNGLTATVGYRIDSDGGVYSVKGTAVLLETWLLSGLNSDYEVRATLVSGDTPSGTLGSWLACSTDRTWSLAAVDEELFCSLSIQIRDAAAPNTVRATCTVDITSSSTPI